MQRFVLLLLIFTALLTCQEQQSNVVQTTYKHKLDPLSLSEIQLVNQVLKEDSRIASLHRFVLIELNEPDKTDINPQREAFTILYNWDTKMTSEVIVDLENATISSWKDVQQSNPPTQAVAAARSKEIIAADPDFFSVLEQLELSSPNTLGYYTLHGNNTEYPNMYYCYMWVNEAKKKDEISYTIVSQYDAKTGQIFGAQSQYGKYSIITDREFTLADFLNQRKVSETIVQEDQNWPNRKPLSITQKQGPGFEINGSKVNWQNWQIHYGISPRRALEIFDVSFNDQGRQRSVLYRAGLSEAVTPYGDPDYRSWFPSDVGDMNMANYGLRPMILGEDTPPQAILQPAITHDHLGNPIRIENAIAIFERDGGLAWRHNNQARRSRELVIKTNVVIDNYDFSMSWIFNQAGAMEAEMVLSGQVQFYPLKTEMDTAGLENRTRHFFTVVGPRLAAPVHQHYFNYRIDLDVDGKQNSIYEMDLQMTEEENNTGEWFYYQAQQLSNEAEAKRMPNVMKSRHWKISNDNLKTELGQAPAYILMPSGTAFPKLKPEAPVLQTYGFLKNHLWVTPYRPLEMHAAGTYVHADLPRNGLTEWTQANRSLDNQDLVLWYTFGFTHLPRPEDWPYMPVHKRGFKLWPFGFFSENPMIGLPSPNPW